MLRMNSNSIVIAFSYQFGAEYTGRFEMGEAGDESSLNGLFKRDSRLHSFVAFGNDIVLLLAI
ncbi:hypothetical protein THZG08_270021 [Vibrio owensii]|nr:hypothetical protein THZG08_270021 [Vibrio owensii]CAH1566084.1 hypothetical protein THOA03_280021 [Vibrio owensii]